MCVPHMCMKIPRSSREKWGGDAEEEGGRSMRDPCSWPVRKIEEKNRTGGAGRALAVSKFGDCSAKWWPEPTWSAYVSVWGQISVS